MSQDSGISGQTELTDVDRSSETPTNPVEPSGRQAGWMVTSSLSLVPLILAFACSLHDARSSPLTVTADRPGLAFNDYLIHFGRTAVAAQPVVSPTFLFRNVGANPVKLVKAIPSCGCIEPELTASELAPGESGRLVLPIRTAGEAPGLHEYTVNLHYTDPQPREVTLAVKIVLPEASVRVEPRSLLLMGKFSEEMEHEVSVIDGRETPLAISDALTVSTSFITARIVRETRDAEGRRTVIGIRISDAMPDGTQRAVVNIPTTDPLFPLLQVPLLIRRREVDSQTVLTEPELVGMQAAPLTEHPAMLNLTVPASWTVDQIDAFPDELAVEFVEGPGPDPSLKKLQLSLRIARLLPEGMQHGVVTMMANGGRNMVSVPVQFFWKH